MAQCLLEYHCQCMMISVGGPATQMPSRVWIASLPFTRWKLAHFPTRSRKTCCLFCVCNSAQALPCDDPCFYAVILSLVLPHHLCLLPFLHPQQRPFSYLLVLSHLRGKILQSQNASISIRLASCLGKKCLVPLIEAQRDVIY